MIEQHIIRRYIAGLESKARHLTSEIERVQGRIDVRRIEAHIIDLDVLSDEQVEVLAKSDIAYVGTVGDSLDDYEALRILQGQLEATSALIDAANTTAGKVAL